MEFDVPSDAKEVSLTREETLEEPSLPAATSPQNHVAPSALDSEAVTLGAVRGEPQEHAEKNDHNRYVQADQQRDESEATPEQKFAARQRVYARDEVTGLLYEAVVRRVMWGPKSRQLNVHLVQDPDQVPLPGEQSDDEDEEPDWCWNYFVHYQGWNTKWDRWVEESCLFEVSDGNKKLANRLKAELKEMKKLKKVGRGARDSDVVAVRRRMIQLEEERREEESKEDLRKQGILVVEEEEEPKMEPEEEKAYELFSSDNFTKVTEELGCTPDDIDKLLRERWRALQKEEQELYKLKYKDCDVPTGGSPSEVTGEKVVRKRKRKLMRKAELEKERKLRQRDLEGKRKQAHAEKIILPFALKKILVDEWEIVSQCEMVPNIPSDIPVKVVLNRYLQSKLDVLRQRQKSEEQNAPDNDKGSASENKTEGGIDGEKESTRHERKGDGRDHQEEEGTKDREEVATSQQGKEWIDMVEGILQYFDESLSVRILYWQEIGQHTDFMKSKGGELACKRKCEVYGCEYLLRLFVRLPSLLEESDIPEAQKRHIYAKTGDLVRFLQKHQDEFFAQRYRNPEKKEITVQKQGRNKQQKVTKGNEVGPSMPKQRVGRGVKPNVENQAEPESKMARFGMDIVKPTKRKRIP